MARAVLGDFWSFEQATAFKAAEAKSVDAGCSIVTDQGTPTDGISSLLCAPAIKTAYYTELFDSTLSLNNTVVWVKFSDVNLFAQAVNEVFFLTCRNNVDDTRWRLSIHGTSSGVHELRLTDSNGTTEQVATGVFTNNVWKRISIAWSRAGGSGQAFVWYGSTKYTVTTAYDFNPGTDTTTDSNLVFEGQVDGAGVPPQTNTWINQVVQHSFALESELPLADWGIKVFRPFGKAGTVPDADELGGTPGDTLTSGDSGNIADDDNLTLAGYTPSGSTLGGAWKCDLDGDKRGPAGRFGPGTVAEGIKWIMWYQNRRGNAGDPYLIYGRVTGAGSYTLAKTNTNEVAGSAKGFYVVQKAGDADIPDFDDEYAVIGFYHGNISTKAVNLRECWVTYLYEYPDGELNKVKILGDVTVLGDVKVNAV